MVFFHALCVEKRPTEILSNYRKKPNQPTKKSWSLLVHSNIFNCKEKLFLKFCFWKLKNILSKDWILFHFSSVYLFPLGITITWGCLLLFFYFLTLLNCFNHKCWDQDDHIWYDLNHSNFVAKIKNISCLEENMGNWKPSSSPILLKCLFIFIECWHL